MKRLLVIHTGGTISMSQDQTNKVITNEENPISQHQNIIGQYAKVDEINLLNIPSPHMTISNVVRLRDEIITYSKENIYDGFVITHGTDTLEETAFLIDLLIDIQEPIVITGAMRSSNEIGSDGLYNFISAIRVATSSESNHKGVMVVFNDEIHTARNVTKTHTSNINTFQSPNQGPLGVLTKNRVQFYHHPYRQTTYQYIDVNLRVPLVKAYMGMEDDVLSFYAQQHVDGIVIEALGQGNLPKSCLNGLQQCLKNKIPLVLVSRSFNGIVSPVYAYEGGGADLKNNDVIFSNGLNGPKARLKLLVGLSQNMTHNQLERYFEE
ncbi:MULTISPECIES: asparaginase [Staphylococcus]|uniref:asparaginase n=1 Tax=Staphylococcus TaxID=1279 RepID=UPI0001F4921E|nr:asparaginase [Staphylococcus epidermidis]MEB2859570.1 asparaginase [Staphylococcus sp. GCP4]ATQ49777.1 asparaginase [Staphylococcus epidermidis]EFV89046.1 asparaginase family protein [Staphylococcus epidermidis FRI909]KAA9392212.1 asparaginase [Staphylococcus epidermidis]MBE7302322.1 asparaginase [Staphylococcus epidermidis]